LRYCIRFKRRATKGLAALPANVRRDLIARIEGLAADPLSPSTSELHGDLAGLRKLRVGDYRIVYAVDEARRAVVIVRLGHRHNVYR
jgi:mRNA interferase RelE/StbE